MAGYELAQPVRAGGVGDLSFEQTVPRALAHRVGLGEVFVADSVRAGTDEFLLAVQIPRAHSVWYDRRIAYHDPLATAEAARQGSFVVIHRHLDVPYGLPFSLQRFGFQVEDLSAYRDNERSPLDGVLRYRVVGQQQRGVEQGDLSFEGSLRIDGALAMSLTADVVFLPPDDYAALRDFQRSRKPLERRWLPDRSALLDPALVGRLDQRNVVIGAPATGEPTDGGSTGGEVRYPLIPDQGHPSFFDHSYDHVPGPFIVEGFRQAALVTANRAGALPSPVAAVVGCDVTFFNFAEFDGLLECSATLSAGAGTGRVEVRVGLHQFGQLLAEGVVQLSPYPSFGGESRAT